MDEDTQQFICTSKPFCLCVGEVNEWDECDCFASENRLWVTCTMCGAAMELIDINTGETIRAAA